MPAQKGALVLIKVGNGGGPETFATLGGLRTSRMILNSQSLDATNMESGAWRQLLANAGIRSVSISGTGIFTDVASEETLRGYAFAHSANNYQFIFASGDYLTGPFQVTRYERSGNHDEEETYALTLESAGNIIYTTL